MIDYIHAFLLWLAVFLPSSSLGPLLAKRGKGFAGAGIQGAFLLLSLTLISLLGIPLGFRPVYLPQAVTLGFLLSLALNLGEKLISEEKVREKAEMPMPEFLPESLLSRVFLLIFLAPLSEETLNRALVEGYILSYDHLWGAILLSAILFALPHWLAFEKASTEERAFIMVGAFVMGVAVAYLFALSGSLLTAFIFHSSANFGGLLLSFHDPFMRENP